jgi:hypothetical protein
MDRGEEQIFRGVYLTHLNLTSPRPNSIYIARIDLRESGISFFVTPPLKTPGFNNSETRLETTLDFARESGVQVAVNANFFYDLNGGNYEPGDPADNRGLSSSSGIKYSEPDGLPSLVIGSDNSAAIVGANTTLPPVYNGVGGLTTVMLGGLPAVCSESRCISANPRTMAGVSEDGRFLYLLIIDGRQPGVSEGMTLGEAAGLLREKGAYSALELDGGGSSTLVISDPDPRVVNMPVGIGNRPGTLRPVSNNLGVYALPLVK